MKKSVKVVLISIIIMVVFTSSAFAQSMLSVGMRGNEVLALQNNLKSLNYQVGTVDGIFGPQTKKGVLAFQSDNGLTVDGIAGPNTLSTIKKMLDANNTTIKPSNQSSSYSGLLKQGMRGTYVVNLQNNLKSLNYSVGPIDGVFGPQTTLAVKAFQKDNGLKVDGIAGTQTFAAIERRLNGNTASTTNRGTTTTTQSKVEKVITTSKSLIGVPYIFGGSTTKGFDCSGFTQYVMNQHGMSIPRTTEDQYTQGISVNRNDLKLGDFVFFETYKPGPSHVGIYIGNNNFIHASSSQGVIISSLDNSYWNPRYISARRIIQ